MAHPTTRLIHLYAIDELFLLLFFDANLGILLSEQLSIKRAESLSTVARLLVLDGTRLA